MYVYERNGYYWVNAKYWDPNTGKRKRVQRSTGIRVDGPGSKRTASIVAEDIARSVAIGTGRKARPETIEDAFKSSLTAKRLAGKSDATVEIVIEKFQQILEVFKPDHKVRDITDKDLAAYAARALKTRKPATVHREILELRSAIRSMGIEPPPAPDLGKLTNPQERWLNTEETMKLLAVVPAKRQDHIRMYRLLGLRKSELFQIEARDVDVIRRNVRVRGTKTLGAERTMPLVGEALDILKRRAAEKPVGQLFETWGDGNADRDLRRWAEKAGLGKLSFNDLRRSFATELALKGVPSLHLAHLLGHTSTRMVETIYARIKAGDHLHDAVAALSSYAPPAHGPEEDSEEQETLVFLSPPRVPAEVVSPSPDVTTLSPDTAGNLDTLDDW